MNRATREKQSFSQWVSNAAQWLTALAAVCAFIALSIISLVQTCRVEIVGVEDHEHVIFLLDSVIPNLIILFVLIVLAVLFMRVIVKRKTANIVAIATTALTAAVGIWWVLSAHALPSADSGQIITTAKDLALGNFQSLRENMYFRLSPYQTGYMLLAEGFFRLFGTNSIALFQIANVLFVCASNIAVLFITRTLFDDARVELFTAVLLGLSLQPAFLSTFLYGTIPGMLMAYWSIYFVVRYMKQRKVYLLIPAAVLIGLAIMVKRNFVILMVAEVVFLLFDTIRSRKPLALIGIAAILALSAALPAGAQKQFETRADVTLGKGMPQISFLVMGLSTSPLSFGWYNSYNDSVMISNNYDYDVALEVCKRDLKACFVDIMAFPYQYFYSFLGKVESQWNEPEYQCIWNSAAGDPETRSAPISNFVESMGIGKASDSIHEYFNQLMQFTYVSMTVSFSVMLLKKRERSEARSIIPLGIIGAIIYHLLFEAKAQYAIIYVHLMMPYAAFGISWLSDALFRKKEASLIQS